VGWYDYGVSGNERIAREGTVIAINAGDAWVRKKGGMSAIVAVAWLSKVGPGPDYPEGTPAALDP
jgi:hypothetical protein